MKKHLKAAALLLTAVLLISLLSGCMDTATQIMIREDGRTTFVQGTYLAEKVITDYGKTPEEYFKTQTDAGGTLSSMECNGNTYWGIVPTPQFYESFEAFCEAMQESSSTLITAYKDPEYGYETVIFNIPSVGKVAEENGQDASQDTSGYADLLVFTANLNIDGGWLGIDRSGKGKEVAQFEFMDENCVLNLVMPCTDEEYQVKIWGSSSPEEEEDDKLISSVRMNLDSPRVGMTPHDVYLDFTTGGDGSIDHKYTEEDWYDMDTDHILEDTEPFKEGGAYGVKFTIYAQEGSAFSDDFTAYINGEPAISSFPENDGPVKRTFGYIFDRLPGENPNLIKTLSVEVAEPKAGAKPQDPREIKLDDTVIFDGNSEKSPARWLWLVSENGGKDPDDWIPMEDAEMTAFEEGHYYALYMMLNPREAQVSMDLKGLINGKESNQWAFPLLGKNTGKITLFHNFGKLGTAGKPEELTTPFNDVSKDDYYYDAVVWAYNAEPQVTDGNGKDKFMPEQTCTRGQVVTFLYRALGYPKIKGGKNPFLDVKQDDYFFEPVLWAVENNVTDGTSPTTFTPGKACTNAQILTFVWRAMGRPDDKGSEKTPEYWRDAYNWAEHNGLLKNTGICIPNINEPCPRKNVVQLLYILSK